MRIVVLVAAVPNPEKVKWDRFRQLLDLQDAEPVLNPVDRHALELAAALAKQTGSAFDAVCAGNGATAALRESAVFGADRLVALEDPALDTADEAGIASTLSAAVTHLGGADVIFCGASTTSFGGGAVPGYVSAKLQTGLLVDALGTESEDGRISVTMLGTDGLWKVDVVLPVIITATSYGIKVRAISPLLLMKAAKKTTLTLNLADIACEIPLATTGIAEGPFESNRTKKGMEIVEGADAATRVITLCGALREKQAI